MALNTKTFTQIVSDQVVAIQARTTALIDFAIGSILRAVVEANAMVAVWFQGLILGLLAMTRAATSTGTDLDSWFADFGFVRLPAVAATGLVTFTRFTVGLEAFIPVGTRIQTSDLTPEVFLVVADTANPAWSNTRQGYVLIASSSSISVPVECETSGVLGNVLAGQCNVLAQSISGVDTVSNSAAFSNGADAESDEAARIRFRSWINSLSRAVNAAIGYAATSLQQGITHKLVENYNYAGAYQPGYFYVVVDDGTGYPSSILQTSVANAVELYRPTCSTFGIFPPEVITANVAAAITTADGYNHAATVALVISALNSYINSLPLGTTLAWSKLTQVAYDASPGVINVTSVTLNSGTADLVATPKQIIKLGTCSVT